MTPLHLWRVLAAGAVLSLSSCERSAPRIFYADTRAMPGVCPGAPVFYIGESIGYVSAIQPQSGRLRLKLLIQRDSLSLHANDRVRLYTRGTQSLKVAVIRPGPLSFPALAAGAVLRDTVEPGVDSIAAILRQRGYRSAVGKCPGS